MEGVRVAPEGAVVLPLMFAQTRKSLEVTRQQERGPTRIEIAVLPPPFGLLSYAIAHTLLNRASMWVRIRSEAAALLVVTAN